MMRAAPLGMHANLLLACTLLHVGAVNAQSAEAPDAKNLISDGALLDTSGNIAINTSAGNGNLQANIAAISIGKNRAVANVTSEQSTASNNMASPGRASSEIGSNALRNASGIIGVNQSSGSGNTQANLVAVATGQIAEVSIDQLGRVSTTREISNQSASGGGPKKYTAVIADSAFLNARGIVQVNQLAGSGNSTANLFTLSVSVASP